MFNLFTLQRRSGLSSTDSPDPRVLHHNQTPAQRRDHEVRKCSLLCGRITKRIILRHWFMSYGFCTVCTDWATQTQTVLIELQYLALPLYSFRLKASVWLKQNFLQKQKRAVFDLALWSHWQVNFIASVFTQHLCLVRCVPWTFGTGTTPQSSYQARVHSAKGCIT